MCGTSPASAVRGSASRAGAGPGTGWAVGEAGASGTGACRTGGDGAGNVAADSLANAGVPPYSTVAARGTTSQRWSTPQRMR